MTMILEAGEQCRHAQTCPRSDTCYGVRPDRQNKFECDYVTNGHLVENPGFRNPMDQTGKMKVIME